MPIRNLDKLFYPGSVAVVGASNREGDPGSLVMHNLLGGGFAGPVLPVSPDQQAIAGVLAYSDIATLPIVPDLAVICAPPDEILAAIRALGRCGTRAAIVLSRGVPREADTEGQSFHHDLLATARPFGMRVLGPNCMGLMVPHIGLNASIAHVPALTGGISFVSQSSAIATSVLDWARQHEIGFSHFMSLGDAVDIDFGDVIDYLGSDAMTRAIMLFIESVRRGRTFMSAGRGASRNKLVLVIKAGRVEEGQRVAALRVRSPIGADDVYDAAIRRAGMLRVFSFTEMFSAVETLARAKPLTGGHLAVVANGYGTAIMAADGVILKGGQLAALTRESRAELEKVVADGSHRDNPINLATDAPPEAYSAATRILLAAPEVDALMVLHVPTALISSTAAAEAVIGAAEGSPGRVLTSWMGGETVAAARRRFAEAGIATYDTPSSAIDAFMHMVHYRRNQELLMETPPSTPEEFSPDRQAARKVIADALAAGRRSLREAAVRTLLSAYGIATTDSHRAETPKAAVAIAERIGFPVSLRRWIAEPESARHPEAGERFADAPAAVRAAAQGILGGGTEGRAEAVLVKKIPFGPGKHLVRVAVAIDPVFGPVLQFGPGGPAPDLAGDRAVGLPPLNMTLARDLIASTRLSRALEGGPDLPSADLDALRLTLVKVSQMIVEIAEIRELDINPLVVDADGVQAVDARVRVAPAEAVAERRLAIRPYPKELEEEFSLASGRRVLIRPIRPEDEPEHYEFLSKISPEDLRFRFFGLLSALPHTQMARFTQIDYDREMAFIATAGKPDGSGAETLGVVRIYADPDNQQAEYAILVRSDLKGQKLGWKLLDKMVRYCRNRGTKQIVGLVQRENKRMLDLILGMGFKLRSVPEEDLYEVVCDLGSAQQKAPPSPPPPEKTIAS